ncbi:MAG: DUF3108 domain-containing protein [Inquilinus sp.]|nr:DUF3108 domain-containing protein [Inquilinus sp.]
MATRRPRLAAIAMSVAFAVSGPAAADTPAVAVHYEVFAGGLHVLSSGMELSLDSRRYDVRVNAQLVGMPGWFADWFAVVQSDGGIDTNGLSPDRNRFERIRHGETRITELDFAEDGGVAVTFSPERNDIGEPLPTDLLAGVLDPLSGVAQLMWAVTGGADCDTTVAVFDGRRRYDLIVTDLGTEELESSRRSAFVGQARRCRMQLEPVAGVFDEDEDSVWNRDSDPRRRRLDIWMANPVADGPAVPVKMVGRSRMGAVVVHLRDARPSSELGRATADASAPDVPTLDCGTPC